MKMKELFFFKWKCTATHTQCRFVEQHLDTHWLDCLGRLVVAPESEGLVAACKHLAFGIELVVDRMGRGTDAVACSCRKIFFFYLCLSYTKYCLTSMDALHMAAVVSAADHDKAVAVAFGHPGTVKDVVVRDTFPVAWGRALEDVVVVVVVAVVVVGERIPKTRKHSFTITFVAKHIASSTYLL
jgi:hypothetical protein